MKEKREVVLDAIMEVSPEKTKYVFIFCHQTIEQNHNIKSAKKSFKIVAKLRHSGMAAHSNFVHEDINSMLNLNSSGCHANQNHCRSDC